MFGKNTSIIKHCIEHFEKTGKKTIYMRRLKSSIEENIAEIIPEFAIKGKNYKEIKYKKNRLYLIDNEEKENEFMLITSMSTYYNLRGKDYSDFDILIFDEFVELSETNYMNREVFLFFDIIETFFRKRKNFKIFMLGNKTIIDTPYEFLKEKPFTLWYNFEKTEEFSKMQRDSILYEISKGSEWHEYAYEQKIQDERILKKKPKPISKLFQFGKLVYTVCSGKVIYCELVEKEKRIDNVERTEIMKCLKQNENIGYTIRYKNKESLNYFIKNYTSTI